MRSSATSFRTARREGAALKALTPGRLVLWLAAALVLGAGAIIGIGYRNAVAAPVVRRLVLTVPRYPATAAPVRIVLFSDVHVHGPDMPPARLEHIVDQINALHPDIAVAAGDFTGNNWIGRDYPVEEAIAPLRRLKAKFGVFAVLGNNDYQAGAGLVSHALERAGVHVLRNEASRAGPVAVGGMDGRLAAMVAARRLTDKAIEQTPGVKMLVAHRPDEFVFAPRSASLVLAGHTHCGQIVLPLVGPLYTGSDYGRKYLCGVIRRRSTVLVVTAGLGTSHIPLRIGAPPDIWLITIKGTNATDTPASQP
jgi:uncharacterized protein